MPTEFAAFSCRKNFVFRCSVLLLVLALLLFNSNDNFPNWAPTNVAFALEEEDEPRCLLDTNDVKKLAFILIMLKCLSCGGGGGCGCCCPCSCQPCCQPCCCCQGCGCKSGILDSCCLMSQTGLHTDRVYPFINNDANWSKFKEVLAMPMAQGMSSKKDIADRKSSDSRTPCSSSKSQSAKSSSFIVDQQVAPLKSLCKQTQGLAQAPFVKSIASKLISSLLDDPINGTDFSSLLGDGELSTFIRLFLNDETAAKQKCCQLMSSIQNIDENLIKLPYSTSELRGRERQGQHNLQLNHRQRHKRLFQSGRRGRENLRKRKRKVNESNHSDTVKQHRKQKTEMVQQPEIVEDLVYSSLGDYRHFDSPTCNCPRSIRNDRKTKEATVRKSKKIKKRDSFYEKEEGDEEVSVEYETGNYATGIRGKNSNHSPKWLQRIWRKIRPSRSHRQNLKAISTSQIKVAELPSSLPEAEAPHPNTNPVRHSLPFSHRTRHENSLLPVLPTAASFFAMATTSSSGVEESGCRDRQKEVNSSFSGEDASVLAEAGITDRTVIEMKSCHLVKKLHADKEYVDNEDVSPSGLRIEQICGGLKADECEGNLTTTDSSEHLWQGNDHLSHKTISSPYRHPLPQTMLYDPGNCGQVNQGCGHIRTSPRSRTTQQAMTETMTKDTNNSLVTGLANPDTMSRTFERGSSHPVNQLAKWPTSKSRIALHPPRTSASYEGKSRRTVTQTVLEREVALQTEDSHTRTLDTARRVRLAKGMGMLPKIILDSRVKLKTFIR